MAEVDGTRPSCRATAGWPPGTAQGSDTDPLILGQEPVLISRTASRFRGGYDSDGQCCVG